MSKRIHIGAKSKKHNCVRCGHHRSQVRVFTRKTGSKYTMCRPCAVSAGLKWEVGE